MQSSFASPVLINLGAPYAPRQDYALPMETTASQTEGESIVYKIPPAVWILVFLLVGYVGMRYVMED